MYPRLITDISKLKSNIDAAAKITKTDGGCSLMIVTKCLCADRKVVEMIGRHPAVDYVADSRIENIKTYSEFVRGCGKETVLMRIPMESEIQDVVRYADVSFDSELSTLELLEKEAAKQRKKHKVLLMIDLGDLREGMFFENENEIFKAVRTVVNSRNLELLGLGTNLTCYGAVIPKKDNLSVLCSWAQRIEGKLNIKMKMISGGNSSSLYLIPKGEMPERINNLRLGEAFLLGNDTAYGTKIPGTCDDALKLEAQIVELKEKPSVPVGESGVDAFGRKPSYEDRGTIKRAILAVGRQDTDPEGLTPEDADIDVLGASSDHLIMDVTG